MAVCAHFRRVWMPESGGRCALRAGTKSSQEMPTSRIRPRIISFRLPFAIAGAQAPAMAMFFHPATGEEFPLLSVHQSVPSRAAGILLSGGFLLAILSGCTAPAPTGELSGTVTYQGKPVAHGSV